MWYSAITLDCVEMTGDFHRDQPLMLHYVTFPMSPRIKWAGSRGWAWTCCIQLRVACVAAESSSEVTHHIRNTACLQGSAAVLLCGLLTEFASSSATDSSLCDVKYGSRNNEPGRETHSLPPWGTNNTETWCLLSSSACNTTAAALQTFMWRHIVFNHSSIEIRCCKTKLS